MSKIDWLGEAQAMRAEIIARRRDFHRHPELAFQEFRTAGIVAETLNQLGLEVSNGVGKTGVVAILEGEHAGPTILIRCDMDALPILEENDVEYRSATPGVMHACGHDGHTAIGLAVAKLLNAHKQNLHGRVKFIFQPAEEIGKGAAAMIADGALANPAPDVSLGLHLWNDLPVGTVSLTNGGILASANDFEITLTGSGGHGGLPHQTIDPIMAAAQIISALQTIVSRNVDSAQAAVVTVGTVHAGSAPNIIPGTAKLTGTYRTYNDAVTDLIEKRLNEIATGIAQALGCRAKISLSRMCPPTVNDSATNQRLNGLFAAMDPNLHLVNDARTMAAEDMSYFLRAAAGSYFFVGSANAQRNLIYPHHHARFDIDEESLPLGAGLLAAAAASYLAGE
jgi:amidohydrolase